MNASTLQIKRVELQIPDYLIKELRFLAIQGYPYEVCGVLHTHNIIHQYPNTFCGDRKHGFDMEINVQDDTIKALWHSHPDGPDEPSADDLPCMRMLIDHGYNFPWIIVTPKAVTEWLGVTY